MSEKILCYRLLVQVSRWILLILCVSMGQFYLPLALFAVTELQPSYVLSQGTPVLIHHASQEFPDVDGKRVVWQDARFGPTEIFMLDLETNEPINLTQSPTWEVQPAIDGDLVVWKDGDDGIGIHGINLATNTIFTVTTGHRHISRPRLSNRIVVWADDRTGKQDWNIYAYDIDRATELVITDAPGNQMDPQIDGPWVVWWDHQERIYLYNLETQESKTVLNSRNARLPAVSASDQLVVWQDRRNGNWDLYGYDFRQGREVEVLVAPRDQENAAIDQGVVLFQSKTPGSNWNIGLLDRTTGQHFLIDLQSGPQVQPAIDRNLVVWQDGRHHHADIFYYSWTGEIPPPITFAVAAPAELQVGALAAGRMILQWQDHADNEDGFVIERASGITGTQWVEIAQLPKNTTDYIDQPPQFAESYWYRVRAQQAGEYSAYSNESFNTTFAETPNLYELYLMTLINSARADPASFGYANYPPVPPLAYNPLLGYVAHSHSQAILNSGFQFGHCDLIDRCPTDRARAVGYSKNCAENLITTSRTGPKAMEESNQSFLESDDHRNNMLAADLTEFGVGHTFDMNKGDSSRHGQVTEVFCGNPDVTLPALATGALFPPIGSTSTSFTYLVNFYSATGEAPTKAEVVIDSTAYPMTLRYGKASHGAYQHVSQLPAGQEHTFYFAFELSGGQQVRWPPAGVIPYPDVFAPADLPNSTQDPLAPIPTFLHLLYMPYVDR